MEERAASPTGPPPLVIGQDGQPDRGSLADLIEWFLNFDERTARIRHPQSNELFLWKQSDDAANGIPVYPFENAEARFAIGVAQAVEANANEAELKSWLTDVLNALHDARETRSEITDAYGLDKKPLDAALVKAEKLPSAGERRVYLSACWFEALLTAEVRVLGWIYQELYGRPFAP